MTPIPFSARLAGVGAGVGVKVAVGVVVRVGVVAGVGVAVRVGVGVGVPWWWCLAGRGFVVRVGAAAEF